MPSIFLYGLGWADLIKFGFVLDKNLVYLGRFTGLQAIWLDRGQPKPHM